METICATHDLLMLRDGVVRVPFLIKGRLIAPPRIERSALEAAFAQAAADAGYVALPDAQALRLPVIDRAARHITAEPRYLLLPALTPLDLVELDIDVLVDGPYALPADAGATYLDLLTSAITSHLALAARVIELERDISELPEALLNAAFAAFAAGLDSVTARRMIDAELSFWGIPGSHLLGEWVEVPGAPLPDPAAILGRDLTLAADPAPMRLRAMPTRQLHITAGNAPGVPIISALRMLLTRSVGVIKLPAGAILPGALLALAAATAAPEHPLTQHLSIVYWPGGDERIEQVLFAPGAFDRIVVWGAPGAVAAVQERAAFTRTITFNPRYGVLLIGAEAFDDLEAVALRAAQDTLIYNQKACNAAFVHYIEGDAGQAARYAEALRGALARWDERAPQVVPPAVRGQLRRMRRGRYVAADWHLNNAGGDYSSGVVVIEDEFDMLEHPLFRLAVVRPVAQLDAALAFLSQAVSTAGVYPETRRIALRDRIAARGVSNILPLGQCERAYAGMPHDGMVVLSDLVEWKNG